MNNYKEYSVIIRCHNEEEHIGRLLSGISAQILRPKEIIIVDSGSTDATLAIASRFPVKIVTIKKEDFSFGRSLNLGCQHAASDILVIVSGHVYPVYKNWSQLLIEPFADEAVALVYGKQRGDENSRYSERRIMQKWFPDFSQNDQKHPFCNNANAAIRRDLWKKIPYNEELMGLEDLDWAKKITYDGYKIVYQSQATVTHVHRETYRQIFNRYYREALALKKIYPEEKFGLREFAKLLTSNIFSDLSDTLKSKQLARHFRDIVLFRFMQFAGSYRGFRDGSTKLSVLKDRFYYPQKESGRNHKIDLTKELEIEYSHITKNGDK